MKQLIITADDYGMSLAVNQAIQEGIENGVITSTNVMMNMPFCDDTDRIKTKGASIGLHWNLTCGKPVLSPDKVPTLVDGDGSFHSISNFRDLYKSGKISNSDITDELFAQYNKYHSIWGEPDYWNSHENVHLWPKTYEVFLQAAAKLHINKMRSHDRIYVPAKNGRGSSSLTWIIMEPIKKLVFSFWKKEASRLDISSPDGKICCLDEKDIHDLAYILEHIQWKQNKIAEFTMHPATECDSPFFGNMTDNRLIEYSIATDKNVLQHIHDAGIELVNFDSV